MSKIKAIRLINLNYNNNAIKVSDETFHLNGESTLLSLRNGGGKSVLVQMLTAPFVHKRYRDAKDRPFESYFNTPKPTFILVEWSLDQGAGCVLTGMMVRKSQAIDGEEPDRLEIVNIVSEYSEPCMQDIHHLPVVERGKKEIVLKSFAACRQLFERFKRENPSRFFFYDMGNAAQSRQYFDKLREYQIHYREWETIIKKVNLEESGLSNLFSDCKDERGLVEKWFLEAVEGKLNREQNRMKEFQSITGKYVGQYKANQSKIKRRDTIRLFKEEGRQIEEKAGQYQAVDEKKSRQENRIAAFIGELEKLKEETAGRLLAVEEEFSENRRALGRVQYERLSGEYHTLAKEQRFFAGNRDMLEAERDALERDAAEYEERLHLLFCAKQRDIVSEEREDFMEAGQRLAVCHKKTEELAPERDYLGYALHCHYATALAENEAGLQEKDGEKGRAEQAVSDRQEKIRETELALRENASREGALKSSVQSYDEAETFFNSRYGAGLARNILGRYEPGLLEIRKEEDRQALEEEARGQRRRQRRLEDGREKSRSLKSALEALDQENQQKQWEKKQALELKDLYGRELAERAPVLKYLELAEADRFDTEKILRASEKKLQEIAGLRRILEKEEDQLERDYRKLTQGRVMELPGELQQEFADRGIRVVYGMEWLKKNGYSEEQNKKIVRDHPFLPYALILSGQELEKLSRLESGVYTSFPVPVVRREFLEEKAGEAAESGVITFPQVSFYVLFNENLLSEEKLALLVREAERKIEKKKEAIAIRNREYEEYFARKETVRGQAVTREKYEANETLLAELERAIQELAVKRDDTAADLAATEETVAGLEKEIRKTERKIEGMERRQEDFARLCEAYGRYEEDCRRLEGCRKEAASLEERQKLDAGQLLREQEHLESLRMEIERLSRVQQELTECCRRYAAYARKPETAADEELEKLDIAGKEARFKAITAGLSQELQELELREQKARKRYEEAGRELRRLQKKYGLADGAWEGCAYTQQEEEHTERQLSGARKNLEEKKRLWNKAQTQVAVLESRKKACLDQIREACGEEGPLALEEIRIRDFDEAKSRLEYQGKQLQKKAASLHEAGQGYEENLTALAEYSDLPQTGPVEWEEPLAELDRGQLRRKKGELARDYKAILENRRDAKEGLVRTLNRILRMDAFADEYYKKPLEILLELTEDASQVLRQLATTVQSFDDLMEKLEVDISVVEKEKERIVELLEEYVREIHANLGRIDSNSTITVRERPLKMLKIQLPDWEENESLYRVRLSDLIDEITRRGIAIFERNENAQEYFGAQLTTKNLYDTVVGIGEVQIKLYKIEEQREYPITWAQVARNSGGEGFLSAFVVLSSLLCYMRRDDTDFFADRNEGKVLVMDNPFAQTNAAHLLKPLMDMAGKANTQLICLTGLGGESIYNRFDNIYVLNLIAASLRNGMQYMKTDHIKGSEPNTLEVSQIEVVEQMELVF